MSTPVNSAADMTAEAKDEMCRQYVTTAAVRRAEIAAILRFTKSLHTPAGHTVLRAEVAPLVVAQRLRKDIFEVFGYQSVMHAIPADAYRPQACFVVQVGTGADVLARQTGMLDRVGQPVQGLPAAVLSGDTETAVAGWRGAFLAAGSLSEPGRGAAVEVACPNVQAALALINIARRVGVEATHRERKGKVQAVISDADHAVRILEAMGAPEIAEIWMLRWKRREARIMAMNGVSYAEVNVRRAARAGLIASVKARRALDILGDTAPDHLREAGQLRVEHQNCSLDALGQFYDPPLSKDAVAGRIRRLLKLADQVAEDAGIPDTASAVADLAGEIDDLFDE